MKKSVGPLQSSMNAGQLAADLGGKVGIKQYYSAAKVMRGVEPIIQSGCRLLPGTAYIDKLTAAAVKHAVLRVSAALSYTLIFEAGKVSIYRNDRVRVAVLAMPEITAAMLPSLQFYGQSNTVGIFHPDLALGRRLLRNAANDTIWTASDWPYENIPRVILDGSYTKTDDVWYVNIHWVSTAPALSLAFKVEGQQLDAVRMSVIPASASAADWNAFCAALQTKIAALPGFASGATVSRRNSDNVSAELSITFSGALSGSEYAVTGDITNTADASLLMTHYTVGETIGEPLISATRKGFAGMGMFQDRAIYFAPAAKTAAINMSEAGEYFNLNIKAVSDNAARLEALRSETSEVIRTVYDNGYLVVFTDQGEWFCTNRTVSRNEAMNFVNSSKIGIMNNCLPAEIEAKLYFVSADGGTLYKVEYDDIATTFSPLARNDLNGDLLSKMKRMVVQRKTIYTPKPRLWVLRQDGRVAVVVIDENQEVFSACEYPIHNGGIVHDISVDGDENVWITVQRGASLFVEVLEPTGFNLFQGARVLALDSSGRVSLPELFWSNASIWAEDATDIYGPFAVLTDGGGTYIQTDMPSISIKMGIWEPPVYESMPYVKVTGNDEVIRRPARVAGAQLYIMDTQSIAIGANGQPAKNVPLNKATDDLSSGVQRSGHIFVAGLKGVAMDATITITQKRPGRLRIRDYIPVVKN